MIVVPSTLDAVIVHAEGALCTRLAWVPLDQGRLPVQVRVAGLPLGLRVGSLRASVLSGPPGLRVRDVRPAFDVKLPPEPELPATQQSLEEAQDTLATIASELERTRKDIASLRNLQPAFPPRGKHEPQPPRESSLTAILSLAGFVDEELAAQQTRLLELERRHREAEEEVELRRKRLQEGSSATRGQRAQLHRAALITLSEAAPSEERVRLALEYAVSGARWVPGYELRMPRTLDGGTLRMRASVLQRTGEDWSQVRLSLSTAALERRADVPELKALRIGRRQPPPARSGWREPPPGLDALFSNYDAALPPPPPSPPVERTRVREFAMPPPAAPPPPPAPAPQRITQSMPVPSAARPMPPGSLGGAPPPAPSAPPPLAPKAKKTGADLMRRRSVMKEEEEDTGNGLFEGAAPELDLMDMDESFEPQGGAPAAASKSQELEPEANLLDYGNLVLGAASQVGQRGRLHSQPEAALQEQLVVMGVHLHLDVFALVAQYERVAESVRNVEPPVGTVLPQESSPNFAHRFDVESRVEVPSDGRWHTVPVLSAAVGLSAEYVSVPSVEPYVFRTVQVNNPTSHALLAGPVDVTLGDEFLMTSPLPTLAPGATQRLGLGVEESIKVSRHTRFDELSGGMFNNANTLLHHVSVELANRTQRPVTVEVLERVPAVPLAEKDIKVDESEVKPAWSKREAAPGEAPVEGERAWKVTLRPGETNKLLATWSIRIPSNKMLVGGNRRT
ncbi:DUF4139 domain-containing protein [Melittangium boletus]|uniref:Aspartate ammonia-lyase n=1 Tax=Melittangium boletus DSM 14713 TaxID=1294270 RepID=A0A250I921_9BACT|nr:DUF4139 domain-containing protein [Melittangium boletus]ATB27466.1 aspartate ammonia-lyase [Melittangium boletus DSM 14713]